jgi:hypothetical protein
VRPRASGLMEEVFSAFGSGNEAETLIGNAFDRFRRSLSFDCVLCC